MTSEATTAYVWTWLPGGSAPVVAGALSKQGSVLRFLYARAYLERDGAISIGPELPLIAGWQEPRNELMVAGCLRDGSPDAWGRRVLEHRLGADENSLGELDYMLATGSNRFGALDFQVSPDAYVPREDSATLDELHRAAWLALAGKPLSPAMDEALVHGTTIGGARPKVLVRDPDGDRQWLAKLSASSDTIFSVVNAEAAALELARRAGLDVPPSKVTRSLGRDVLLVRRFDREADGLRRHALSALTLSQMDEMAARYVTYPGTLDVIMAHAISPERESRRLFERIVFNIAISNSDDHARNHAVFWDGEHMSLTPAYDLAPGPRSGETSRQAMAITRDGKRDSTFRLCLDAAHTYGLSRASARESIDRIEEAVRDNWDDAAELSRLTAADKSRLWGRQILNPASVRDYRSAPRG